MGYAPDWFGIIQTAKYLGVAPWDLLQQPVIWQHWAQAAASAEIEARKQLEKRRNK